MAIHTHTSLAGFIASDPQLTHTSTGDARLYVKIGQEHYVKNPDGTFTQTETTFHDLVAFRKTAERAHDRLAKGDRFLAEGYVRHYDRPAPDTASTPGEGQDTDPDARQSEGQVREEFVARRLGHDLAITDYTVQRTRRASNTPARRSVGQEPPGLARRGTGAGATAPGIGR